MRQGRDGTSEGGCQGTAPTLSCRARAAGQALQAGPGEAEGKWQEGFGDPQPTREGGNRHLGAGKEKGETTRTQADGDKHHPHLPSQYPFYRRE